MPERRIIPTIPEKFLKDAAAYAVILLCVLRLFLPPLLKNQYNYVYDDLSNSAIAALIFLTAIVFLLRKCITKEAVLLSGCELPIGLLAAASLCSLGHSAYLGGSLLSFAVLMSCVACFYMVLDLFQSAAGRRNVFIGLMACFLVLGVFAVREYFLPSSTHLHGTDRPLPGTLSYRRIASVFESPNVLAGFYMLFLPLMGAFALLAVKPWQRQLAFFLLGLSTLVFWMTLSLLCTVNFILATAVMAPWIMKEWFNKSINKSFFVILLVCAAAGFLFITGLRKDFSVVSRWEYLKAAWLLLKEHPWLGTGIDTFRYLSPQHSYHQTYSGYVHNSYLQVWLETGITGLIAVVLLVLTCARRFLESLAAQKDRSQRILLAAFGWGIGAYFIDNLTNFTMLSPQTSLFGWILIAGLCSLKPIHRRLPVHPLVLFAGLLLSGILFLQCVFKTAAFVDCQKAMSALNERNYPASYEWLQKARKLDPTNQNFPGVQGLLDMRVYESTGGSEFLRLAEEHFKEASRLSPFYYVNYVMLAKIARADGNDAKTKEYLHRVAQLCPGGYFYFKQEVLSAPSR